MGDGAAAIRSCRVWGHTRLGIAVGWRRRRRETAEEGGPNLCCLWPLEFPGTGISRHFLSHFIILNSNSLFIYGLLFCVLPAFLVSQCSKPPLWIVSPCHAGRGTTRAHTS